MNAVELEHPTGAVLTAYGLGQLNEDELAAIDEHLAACAACRQVVQGVAPDTFLMLLRSAATEPDSKDGGAEVLRSPGAPKSPDGLDGVLRGFGVPQPRPRIAPPIMDHPRYRVGELLGVGGMGAVYRAEHLLMERPVALKVLNRELIDKPATIERFRREVRAAARLTHPNIVAAFDAEQAGDAHFLVMEYVEGVSLARHLAEKGPLPVGEACDYARQAALGLQHAHERGMVHRDIKPQNLMLTPSGQVKILDFGLARFVMESVPAGALLSAEATPPFSPNEEGKPLTQTGMVMGTPDYIAPEQARDSHLADIRADIYSLGCTLYDLLAGQAPFSEGSAAQKVKAHLDRTPKPLREFRPDVPPELARVVGRMMAKDPAQRFQTPAEVVDALAPFLGAAPKLPRRKKWLLPAAMAGLVAALLAGVVIYVQTDRGTITIETNDEKIAVMIEKAGGVKIVDQANKREYLLRPGAQELPRGDYQIEVSEALAGLDFQVKKFELKRGGEVRLTARFEPALKRENGDVAVLPTQRSGDEDILYNGKPTSFWLHQFRDANPILRTEAVEALGNIAQKNKDLIPVLIAALNDKANYSTPQKPKHFWVAYEAAKALGALGPEVVPALLKVLKDNKSPTALSYAAFALGQIGPEAKAAVPLLTEMLKVEDSDVPRSAISALSRIGSEAKPAIPAMVDLLGEYLKSKDFSQYAKRASEGVFFDSPSGPPLAVILVAAVTEIDPEIKGILPKEIYGGRTQFGGVNQEAPATLWQKAYDALKKRYQSQAAGDGQASMADRVLQQELARFEGIWSNVKTQMRWETSFPQLKYVFKGKTMTVMEANNHRSLSTFKIDPSKSPKNIDIDRPPQGDKAASVGLGIYEFSNDTLKICVGTGTDAQRPTTFEDTDKSLAIVFLKKVKPAEPGGSISATVLTTPERKRALDRLETLKEIANLKEIMYREGKLIFDQVLEAKREVARAELDLCESDVEQLKVHEKIVALAQELVKFREVQYQGAQIPQVAALKAKADLLEAQTDLDRAKAGTKARDSVIPRQAPGDQGPLFGGKPASFWLEHLKDANPTFRIKAVEALGMIAQKNKDLIPPLVAALKDEGQGVALRASRALGALGPEVVPALLDVLKDKTSPGAVRWAAVAVAQIGPEAKAAVPLLTQALNVEDWNVRGSAIYALGKIGAEAKPAIPDMIEILGTYIKSVDLDIKKGKINTAAFGSNSFADAVMSALPKIDPEIPDISTEANRIKPGFTPEIRVLAWQQVFEALKKKYPAQRPTPSPDGKPKEGSSRDAASKSELDKKDQAPFYHGKPASYWMNQSNDVDPKFRVEAVQALGFFAQKDKELVPLLVAYLKDKDTAVARQAADTLGSVGQAALPALLEILKDKSSPTMIARAARAVGMMGLGGAKAAVPLLAQALKMDDREVRAHSINALGLIGPDAKAALPDIIELLGVYVSSPGDERAVAPWPSNKELCLMIRHALVNIDPETETILPPQSYPLNSTYWPKAYETLKKKYQVAK